MMKHLAITALVTFLTFEVTGQTQYEIKWKIAENEKIAYLTVMEQLAEAEIDAPYFFKSLQEASSDSTKNTDFDFRKLAEKLNAGVKDFSSITILQKQNEWINVNMIREDFRETENSDSMGISSFMKGVQLRGLINQNGNIQSFYTKWDQKNLLALFFQLPSKPVKIGEKWSIDLNWISMDQNFMCDSMRQVNEVQLVDVFKRKGERIARIKYKIHEKVNGDFKFPLGNRSVYTMFDMKYDAICEFSISEGKWVNYSGILSLHSTGYQNTKYKQRFALIEKEEVPEIINKYLK